MATLLVPASKGLAEGRGSRRRRLSFRRAERRADPFPPPPPPPTPENAPRHAKKAALNGKQGDGSSRALLLLWTEIEEWQQRGSDHIKTGYRKANNSVQECFCSWTYFHNESVNIYSHVLGALLFLALPGCIFFLNLVVDSDLDLNFTISLSLAFPLRYQVATPTDLFVCTTYLVGVAICFLLSVGFHTLMAHSETVYLLGMKLDIQGVLVLMWAATIPLVYYVFPCDHHLDLGLRLGYWGLFTALAGLCSAVTFLPRFSGPHLGPYRAALFGSFGAGSFALPIAHGVVRYGVDEMWRRVGMGWIMATVICNGIGVGVYAMKFPERWYPRRFDLLGASHQLMHIFVVAAALTYACAVVQAFDYRHEHDLVCEI